MASSEREEEHSEQAFTVSDKRLFTKEGQRREDDDRPEPPRASTPPPPSTPEPPPHAPPPSMDTPPPPPGEMPPAEFSTFVAMMANNIMMFLGQIPDPITQQRRVDLAQAKHSIDILMMLQEKTQGNLTTEEARLLEEILPQLQMAFVSMSRHNG